MCAQIFQKSLNLNTRHPEIIYKRNSHIGWSAGGWERPAFLFAECNVHGWVWRGFFHTMSRFGARRQQSHTWLDSMILKVLSNLGNSMIVWLKSLLFLSVHSTYIWPHSLGLGIGRNKRTVQRGLDVKYGGLSCSHALFAAWDMTAIELGSK